MGAMCPKCASAVALHEGKPNVTPSGVELWHATCWAVRHARPVEEVTVVAPRSRLASAVDWWSNAAAPRVIDAGRWRYLAGGVAAVLALVVAIKPAHPMPASAAVFQPDDGDDDVLVPAYRTTAQVDPPPQLREPVFTVPVIDGVALDEQFPSLLDWIHPVTGTTEKVPEQASRHFGAERRGVERSECGAGHCGVDLDGPEGRPVVAVADGVVVRVERHELGLDGKSGRYVRIEHDDGTLTAYMHLDEIVDGLEPGDHVDGGQYIGTLGATAVYASVPHLHFSLEIPNVPGHHGDNTNTHYVDPAPFLARAAVSPTPERRHAIKPAL
ncbi:MAG: M23 family metallopeptidase [Deltaproteobacteria bacterium]